MSHHVIDFDRVQFTYPDGTKALDDVTFRILHGESVGIVGANGAGKSTLLMQMNGTLMATSGAVRIGEAILSRQTVKSIRRRIGFVFQNPDDQLFMPRVLDDVAFGPLNLGWAPGDVERAATRALEQVNCLQLKERPPHKLSQGQKRSVSIATVLSMDPDILVMDEPSSNLDPRSRRQLIELLSTFRHTKILATHDLDMVMELCERIIVLNQGQVVVDGPTPAIFSDESLLKENGLEKPLSIQSIPR